MDVAIIGASSGIGRAVANIFAENKHNVICSSRDENELDSLVSDLRIRYDIKAYAVAVDLTNNLSIKKFIKRSYELFKTIDCCIVTAAVVDSVDKPYYDEEELINTTNANYTGIALTLNEISRRMAGGNSGVIMCLSSVAGDRGRQSNFIYGASKSALITYLQGLRMKMYKHNVHVITVLPGYIDTIMAYGRIRNSLAVSPQYAARKIYKLVKSKRNIVYIPPVWWLVMKIIKLVPESIFKRLSL
jgi:short-subunit dehydrogenase